MRFSLANYLRITRGLEIEIDFNTAYSVIPAVHTGIAEMGARSVARYIDSWVPWGMRHRDRVMTFEQWVHSPEDGLAELLAHLGIEVDQEAVAKACAASAFDRMRRIEHESLRPVTPESDPDSRFVRRGRPGGWRELPPEHAAMLEAALRRWLTPRARKLLAAHGLWSAAP